MRESRILGISLLVQAALVAWTAFAPWSRGDNLWLGGFGVPLWHYHVSLVASLAITTGIVMLRRGQKRLWQDRAHLGIWILVWTTLALVSGFFLLYMKQDLKDAGLKDWMKWWHITWSWFALWYFVLHTAINWEPWKRAIVKMGTAAQGWYGAVLALIIIAIPLTWNTMAAQSFTDANYIPMTLWTWIAMLVPAYGLWLLWVLRYKNRFSGPAWTDRPAIQRFVDAYLVPMTLLANISGFPILYFGTKDTVLKYVAKYWHTWPSIAMAILVFAHTIQFWSGVKRHYKVVRTPR